MTSPQMRTSVRERYAEAAIGFDKLLAPEDQKGAIEALPPAADTGSLVVRVLLGQEMARSIQARKNGFPPSPWMARPHLWSVPMEGHCDRRPVP
ncbi:unnamed protein product [Boreogadus saida]